MDVQKQENIKTHIKRLIRAVKYARPHKWQVSIILLLTFMVAGINAFEPIIMKYIFDNLTSPAPVKSALMGIAGLFLASLLREALSGYSNWLTWRTRLNIQFGLLSATVDKIHRLPHDVHRREGVGALMTKLDRGINGFMSALTEISFNMLPAIAYLSLAIFFMSQLSWKLTIVTVLFAPVPAIIASFAAPTQTRREQTLLDKWVRIYSRFNEVLSGIVTVRSFAMEDAEKKRFLRDVNEANRTVVNGIKYDTTFGSFQNISITFARITAIAYGSVLIIRGEATLGTLVAFLSYVGGLFGPVQGLTGMYKTLRTATVSLKTIFDILDAQDFLGDAPNAVELENFKGEVNIEDVHFSYGSNGNTILNGINLKANPGEMVAIVGPSGSGKSTLMALLMRFYDPSAGRITLDGVDIRKIKQIWLRRQISVVLQDALLFNESIKDNIAYGKPDAGDKEIIDAARAANAHEFILRMENGYDTMAGEKGSRLSVGERQRIAIARAILKNSPILILDEATSALDAELEALVQEALERLITGRTTFVIAHRLATVVNANKIAVIKNGKVVELGNHVKLIHQ
ncbi:MAG TPA: ABC transporter ATP-binding protein, partial [Ignavibacteriales bacterium]|nr:ABC transporter ATP-binding protein [Ignavibacteriales bacterium]